MAPTVETVNGPVRGSHDQGVARFLGIPYAAAPFGSRRLPCAGVDPRWGLHERSGAVPTYDGTAFARDGVVCVTINYRLGAERFLDTVDGQTNIGIRDQIAALEWVKQNIAAFGGDPDPVDSQ